MPIDRPSERRPLRQRGPDPGRARSPALDLLRTFWSTLPGVARPDWDKLTQVHVDLEDEFRGIYELARSNTMTTAIRMYNLYKAVCYVIDRDIPGDFVECGVWRGGSAMVAARTFCNHSATNRELYLYDTYQGMTKPTEKDVDWTDHHADRLIKPGRHTDDKGPAAVDIEVVRKNMQSTDYPMEKIRFVKGDVLETIPATMPKEISILRLDTDWHELTYHQMKHLYPLLSQGGVLIVDDYGFWKGCKEAVDQYFSETGQDILLMKLDQHARMGIKYSA